MERVQSTLAKHSIVWSKVECNLSCAATTTGEHSLAARAILPFLSE